MVLPKTAVVENVDAMLSTLANARATYYPLGLRTAATAADHRKMALRRAVRRLDEAKTPGYAFATLRPRLWSTALQQLGVHEPDFLARRLMPERECEAALAPANVSWLFEQSLHWRMIAIGALEGAGMHMHVDSPALSTWHVQLRGRKRWTLCPPPGDTTGSNCSTAILHAGQSVFYPAFYAHSTRTLDAGAVSLSRSLITPGHAAHTAEELSAYFGCGGDSESCDATVRGANSDAYCNAGSYDVLCDAVRPCLRRLLLWGGSRYALGEQMPATRLDL